MTWATPMLAGLVAAVAIPALVILYFLKLRRTPREITAMTIQSDTTPDTLLLEYLRKRGLLR